MYKKLLFFCFLIMLIETSAEVIPTNEWVSFYGLNSTLNNAPLPVGTVIDAYDPDGVHCGHCVVNTLGAYGLLAVYRDDATSLNIDEGADPGDIISFKVDNVTVSEIGVWTTNGDVIELDIHALIPYINISPSFLNFAQVTVNNQVSADLSIKNVGGTDLIISNIGWVSGGGLIGRNPVLSVSDSQGAVLPGDSLVITVTFTPILGKGIIVDTLCISSNDPDNPLLKIRVTGEIKSDVISTTEWVSFYSLNSTFHNAPLITGDVVDAYDPDGIHCGVFVVHTTGVYGAMAVYRDDATTSDIDEGADPGDVIDFKINGSSATPLGPDENIWTTHGDILEVNVEISENHPPIIIKLIYDLIMDEDALDLAFVDLDTVFKDPDPDDILQYSINISTPFIECNIDNENVITISLAQNWSGLAFLWITATDISGESVTYKIKIIVNSVNDPPMIIRSIADVIMDEDDPDLLLCDLDDIFSDVDGDILNFSIESDTSAVSVTINSDNNAIISLAKDWNGFAQLILKGSDGEYIASDTVKVTVNPINDTPLLVNPINDIILYEDNADTIIADLDDVFEDIEGDPLTFSSTVSDENVRITIDSENVVTISLSADWNGSVEAIFSASDGVTTGSDSVLIFVIAINDDPTTPIILLPPNGTELRPDGYLKWTLSSDVDFGDTLKYHIQIDDNSSFNSPEIDNSGIGTKSILKTGLNQRKTMNQQTIDSAFAIQLKDLDQFDNLIDNTIYYWRISAIDNKNGKSEWTDGTNNFFFNKINNPPNVVTEGFNPADSIIICSITPTIEWNSATDPDLSDPPGTLYYILQVSSFFSFKDTLYEYQTETGITQIEVDELADDAIFFYRIKTYDDEGLFSEWSEIQMFIINIESNPPNPFNLLLPIDGSIDTLRIGSTIPVNFIWESTSDSDFGDHVVKYVLYCQENTFDKIDDIEGIQSGLDTNLTIEIGVGEYYWRVAAFDSDSLFTIAPQINEAPWKITVVTSVEMVPTEKVPDKFSLSQNYPNPFNPITKIRYDIPVQIEVELIIYDILGKKIKTLIYQTLQPGFYEAIWDGTNERGLNVPSGMYFYRLNTPNYSKTYKMIFLK